VRLPIILLLLALALSLSTTPSQIQPLQVKVCPTAAGGACQFDNPTSTGSLIGAVAGMGSGGTAYPTYCSFVTDSQKNNWACANKEPYWNGIPIWYALNSAGGTRDILYFASGIGADAIIFEYPPVKSFDDSKFGTYDGQNISDCLPQGGNCYAGWTLPIETDEPCELMLTWGTMGGDGLRLQAGPNFTMRTSNGVLFLEDQTTSVPGLYFGSARWEYGNHWLMQSATFKTGGCR
jgi:hypothetical protein